jgi:hypothetical protein
LFTNIFINKLLITVLSYHFIGAQNPIAPGFSGSENEKIKGNRVCLNSGNAIWEFYFAAPW